MGVFFVGVQSNACVQRFSKDMVLYIYIYHINIVCSMENDIGWVNENMSNVSIL